MPPDDPLGRNGPSLDEFLRRRWIGFGEQRPCPYGKKCTYGNKCKFFHEERRSNEPQKSITDKLKEDSSHKISKVRARDRSRDSSSSSSPRMEQLLVRTLSAQPLSSRQQPGGGPPEQQKSALCRTRSTFPRIGGGVQEPPQIRLPPTQSQQLPCWSGPPPPLPASIKSFSDPRRQGEAALVRHGDKRSFSCDNVNLPPPPVYRSSPSPLEEPLALPDTRLPPPPPRSPWGMAAAAGNSSSSSNLLQDSAANPHRKLARQLTLNPGFDSRLHGASPPAPPFPPPPPSLAALDHAAIARNVSAPEQGSCCHQEDLGAYAHDEAAPPPPPPSGSVGTISQSRRSLSQAVSPLISSSVWGHQTDEEAARHVMARHPAETRSKLYYHLAAVFPEEQVLVAMRALPEETDPQKICSYILTLGAGNRA